MRINGKTVMSGLLTLLFLFFIAAAAGYNPGARLVPLIVAIPIFCVSMAQFVTDLRAAGNKSADKGESSAEDSGKKGKKGKFTRVEMGAIAWLAGFIAAILVLGFHIAITAFSFLFTRFYGKEKWLTCFIITAACWLCVYLAFVVGLKAYMYPGLLF